MKQTKVSLIAVVFGAFFWLLPSVGEAGTKKLTCGATKTIQKALTSLKPGDTLLVSGTCNENVVVNESHERITIDGQTTATINGPDNTRPTVHIRGRKITLTGFTITGGEDGINIGNGGGAQVSASTIQNTGRFGISVHEASNVRVTNSTIQNNPGHGIFIGQSSSARIGFLTFEGLDTIPGGVGPNTIQNNGRHGIRVVGSSSADITDNTISNNTRAGVQVAEASHARIASNTINGNGEHGINVGENSGVNLGEDTGTELDESPNSTTANNTGFGINCFINSYANGRLGTLNGASGAKSFAGSCVDSLEP